jgi:hypothetical protein
MVANTRSPLVGPAEAGPYRDVNSSGGSSRFAKGKRDAAGDRRRDHKKSRKTRNVLKGQP